MKNKNKIRNFLKAAVVLAITLTFIVPASAVIRKTNLAIDSVPDYYISAKQVQEMMDSDVKVIVLDVRDTKDDDADHFPGTVSVLIESLGCPCFYTVLEGYDIIVVYSDMLSEEARDILIMNGFENVNILTGDFSALEGGFEESAQASPSTPGQNSVIDCTPYINCDAAHPGCVTLCNIANNAWVTYCRCVVLHGGDVPACAGAKSDWEAAIKAFLDCERGYSISRMDAEQAEQVNAVPR